MLGLEFRRAQPDDAPQIAQLLRDAAAWMATIGIDWQPWRFTEEKIRGRIASHEVYCVMHGDKLVGTVSLHWSDPSIWEAEGDDGQAVYIHRLAISRDFAGQHIGERMLEFAMTRGREQGKPLMRLDCFAKNPRLRLYYEGLGFRFVRLIMNGDTEVALYEMRL